MNELLTVVNTGRSVVTMRQLQRVVERVRDAVESVDRRVDRLTARLRDDGEALEKRLGVIEAADVLRLTVVPNAGALPASAGVLQWFRVQGDPAVYVGNGAGQPLRKIATVVI